MNKYYQNLIFTDHALERMKLRNLSQEKVKQVLAHPDRSFPSDKSGQIKFIRTLNQRTLHVIGKYLTEQKKWLIISLWVRGEDDPIPLTWKLITWPFKIIAKIARIITSYIKKYLLESKKL